MWYNVYTVKGADNPTNRRKAKRMFEYFSKEIDQIESEDLRMFVKFYLDEKVPSYFWKIGASSSGKFHPVFSQGEGGLVRHTKAVCAFCEELLRMSQWAYMKDEYKDLARVACICHDTAKYGLEDFDKEEYPNHAANAAKLVDFAWREYFNEPAPFLLTQAIKSHMGQWSTDREDRPFTNIDRLVHLADYIASRNFIDIPEITSDYNSTFSGEEDLPF